MNLIAYQVQFGFSTSWSEENYRPTKIYGIAGHTLYHSNRYPSLHTMPMAG